MKSYLIDNNEISQEVANNIQYDMIAAKVDENPTLVENGNLRRNTTLSSEYFENNERTIVNSINKAYQQALSSESKSQDAINIIKNTVGDTEEASVLEKLNLMKTATNSSDLISILYSFTNETINEAETDIIDWENN